MKNDEKKVVGIKKAVSKKSGVVFFTLYLTSSYTDYEIENCDVQGVSCESVGYSGNLGIDTINVGDIIEVNYGKAFGDYQPVKNIVVLTPATPFSKKEKE